MRLLNSSSLAQAPRAVARAECQLFFNALSEGKLAFISQSARRFHTILDTGATA